MSERMQSLLSRAVEDQLSEQRQLTGVLAEIRAVLGRLDERAAALQGTGGDSAAQQVEQAVGAVSADVREAVRVLAERIDGVGRLVGQRGQDLVEIRAAIAELRESLDAQATAVGGVAGGLGALSSFGERIEALQGALGGLHERLGGLEQLVVGVETLQQRGDATETAVRELRHAFTGVAARIAELPPRSDVEALLDRPSEALDTLGSRLARLEGALPGLLERLDAIDAVTAGHGERVDELLSRLADGRPADVTRPDGESTAAALADLRSELERRLDELAARGTDAEAVERLAEQVAELRDALLDDGDADGAVETAPGEDASAQPFDVAAVEQAVARAVADSEQRLTAHVDSAVLALAEALLRRRSVREGARADILAAAAPAVPVEPPAPLEEEEPDEPEAVGDEEAQEEPEADVDEDGYTPAWQTPTGWDAETDQSPEPPRKRKPWWRPGD
jgi:hypothetical protein